MGRALFYYEWHSRWNRLCARLRRLRQPKYLFGAVAGGLYFYFYIFGAWFRGSAPGAAASMLAPEHRFLLASAGALVLSVVLLLMWVIPHERAALMFSEAEVAFLFPAPVARRTLLHFKLLKSQGAILFSALFMLVIGRWSGGNYLFHYIGWWGLLSLINLHMLGSSFARTMLLERGISNWRRRLFVLGGVALAAAGVVLWARQALPPPPDLSGDWSFSVLSGYAEQLLKSGPLPWLLAPFRWAVAPLFADGAREFCLALGPLLAMIALHYLVGHPRQCRLRGGLGRIVPQIRRTHLGHAFRQLAGHAQAQKGQAASFCIAAPRMARRRHLLEKPHQRRPVLHRPLLAFSHLDHRCRRLDRALWRTPCRQWASPSPFWPFPSP